MRRRSVLLVAVAAVLIAVWAWRTWWPSDPQLINRRLQSFAAEFNDSTRDGLGTVARATQLGSYFTGDIVVDFGKGTPPIQGRATLIGMAARLQPRTAAFTVELLDITVHMRSESTADVNLTAAFRRRSLATGEEALDAREFLLTMVKADGEWRASRVTAVEPFR